MADWAIINWIKKDNKRSKIWAILPVESRAVLPQIDTDGYWEEFRRIASDRFPEAEDAKAAIADDGFYFTRESVAIGALNGPRT